jgi:hypothetical protein
LMLKGMNVERVMENGQKGVGRTHSYMRDWEAEPPDSVSL